MAKMVRMIGGKCWHGVVAVTIYSLVCTRGRRKYWSWGGGGSNIMKNENTLHL